MNLPFSASRAYLIGVAGYQYSPWQLNTPVSDALALGTLLRHRHAFQTTIVSDPTATQLCQLFEQIRQKNNDSDARVLIYYAGHGVQRDSAYGLKGFFVPADAQPGDDKSLVPMELLADTLQQIKSRHILLILDCCFAGSFRMQQHRGLAIWEESDRFLFRQHYEIYSQFPSRLVLSSTSYRQKAYDRIEDDDLNSPFNRFLCKALEGEADYTRDRLITASELKTYLVDHVSRLTGYAGNVQSVGLDPLNNDGEGEFLFFLDGFNPNQLREQDYLNPYKGLQSYESADATLFFGRQKATEALLKKVKNNPLVIIAGASGTGKSSLVKAGLLPALRREVVNGHRIAIIRPGKNPLSSLAQAKQFDMLIVDQWEELITQAQDVKEAEQFFTHIRKLLDSGKRIVVTVRADFEAQTRHEILDPFWTQGRFVVPPFSSEEYHDIIVQPAKRVACLFEDRELVLEIEQEVAQQPGPLPLLSFMLSELFEKAKTETSRYREIKRRHYKVIGGVSGALRNKAEALYDQLPDDNHRDAMRRLMLRMISLSPGEMSGRRVFLEDLDFGPDQKKVVDRVVTTLTEARLIRNTTPKAEFDMKGQTDQPEVEAKIDQRPFIEPAHDALVRAWKRLWDWVRELGEDNLLLHTKLIAAVDDYRINQQKKGFLWTADPRLEQSKALLSRDSMLFNTAERSFIELSLREKIRRTRNTWIIVIAVILGLSGLAGIAWWQGGEARMQQATAEKTLANFLHADSVRIAEETAKERLNFDTYVREGDIYMASFDYDLALSRYLKADTLYQRFSDDPDMRIKIGEVRAKIETAKANLKIEPK